MREQILHDRFLRNLIWLGEVTPRSAVEWLESRFPEQMKPDRHCCYSVVSDFLHRFVFPAFIERFVPWLMPHWPIIECNCRVSWECEFPKTGTALVSMWWDQQGVHPNEQPIAMAHIVVKDGMVFDPDLERLVSVEDYLRLCERGVNKQGITNVRTVYVAERPIIS